MSSSVGQMSDTMGTTIQIDDSNPNLKRSMKIAFIALALLIGGLGLAGIAIPIGGAVMGAGQVGVESRIKRISHPTGGIITAIYVENGDRVGKGTPLLRFDDTVTGADARLSMLAVDQLLAQRARLEAERMGRGSVVGPRHSRRVGARRRARR